MRLVDLPLDRRQFSEFVENLRFDFHKWDAYAGGEQRVLPYCLNLEAAEHAAVVALCERVSEILARLSKRLRERVELLDALGLPPVLRDLLLADSDSTYQIARYDLIKTAQGWMIPEFNEDAPGGFNENLAADALLRSQVPGLDGGVSLKTALQAGFPPGERVGMVYATGYAEDLQHVLVLADLLREQGREAFTASPIELSSRWGRCRLKGQSLDWLFRFFPVEWYQYLEDLRPWRRAVADGLLVNPFIRILRQSKMLYALWREEDLLAKEDLAFLNSCTPYTERFQPEALRRYQAQRERLVLKKSFGRMGDAVVIGAYCRQPVWDKSLEEARAAANQFIIQERFIPEPVLSGARVWYPAVGAYLVNGKFAGYYSRADRIGFTTNEAYYVATAVEDA